MNLKMGNELRSRFAVDAFTAPKDLIAFKVFRNSEEEQMFLGVAGDIAHCGTGDFNEKTPPGKFRLSEF